MSKRAGPLKIDMPFEDALRHILGVGPMPRTDKPARPARKKKTARKKRSSRS